MVSRFWKALHVDSTFNFRNEEPTILADSLKESTWCEVK